VRRTEADHCHPAITTAPPLPALVGAGVGVALVPELTIVQVPDGVRLLPLTVPVARNDYAVIRAGSATDPGLARVRALLAETAAQVLTDRELTSARR
jgi:DNA-binding transcriptional LysR family regulator